MVDGDAMTGDFDELSRTREMLDRRYDDLKGVSVKLIDGEGFFETLRIREEELRESRDPFTTDQEKR